MQSSVLLYLRRTQVLENTHFKNLNPQLINTKTSPWTTKRNLKTNEGIAAFTFMVYIIFLLDKSIGCLLCLSPQ